MLLNCIVVSTFALLLHQASGAPHHPPHATFHFYHDPDGNYIVGGNSLVCFVTTLTLDEQDDMHTNIGVARIESIMMHDWIGKLPEERVLHDDPRVTKNIQHWCHSQDLLYLDRSSQAPHVVATTIGLFPVSTTPSTAIITRRSATTMPSGLLSPTTPSS